MKCKNIYIIFFFFMVPLFAHGAVNGLEKSGGMFERTNAIIAPRLGNTDKAYAINQDSREALNPAHGYSIQFSSTGPIFKVGGSIFSFRLKDSSYLSPSIKENVVTYVRNNLAEWYVNSPLGVEQGFTIERDEDPQASIQLSFVTEGMKEVRLQDDKKGVSFITSNNKVYTHQNLTAYDAKGLALPAQFVIGEKNTFSIIVDDSHATYPIVIDPFLNEQSLTTSGVSGSSVAMSKDGTRLAISDTSYNSNQGAIYIFKRSGDAWTEEQRITALDGVAGDVFGGSFDFTENGDRIATVATIASGTEGVAYVFSRSGTTWTEEQRIVRTDGAAGDYLAAVKIAGDGTRLVLGTQFASSSQGRAYVFSRSGTTWTEEQRLTVADGESGDRYGSAVAIDGAGDRIAIAADQKDSEFGVDTGVVYVFSRSGTTWSEEQRLTVADGESGDRYGSAVAIDGAGDRIAIAADQKDSEFGVDTGVVYVFSRSGTTWTEEQRLTANDPTADARFGVRVSLTDDGTRMLATAYSINANTGAAYILSRSGTTWTEEQKVTASDAAPSSYFGVAGNIAGDGNRLIISAYNTNGGRGTVYDFSRSGTTWTEQQSITASDAAPNNFFGISVADSDDGVRLIVGSYINKAYAFELYHAVTLQADGNGTGAASSNLGGISFSYPGTAIDSENVLHGTGIVITGTATTGQISVMDDACLASGGSLTKTGTEISICRIPSITTTTTLGLSFVIPATVNVGSGYTTGSAPGSGGGTSAPSTPAPSPSPITVAASSTDAEAFIRSLQQQLKDLQARAGGTRTLFARDLRLGMTGDDVKALQVYLNAKGFAVAATGLGSTGNETTFFGRGTKQALIRFQNAHRAEILAPAGLTEGTGFFGSATRAFIQAN